MTWSPQQVLILRDRMPCTVHGEKGTPHVAENEHQNTKLMLK